MTFHQLKKLGGCINASCFEFLPKENWIISVLGSTINIHNYSTGALIKSYEYHNDPLICIVVIQSKTNLELFSLDELGLIKCVNLKTDFMIFSFHLKENVKAGFINKKMKKIYYTTKNVLKIFNFFNNEISSINPKVENSELTEFHGLKSSKDENFAVEFSGKNIILYDLTENKILNIIKHDNFISSIDLNHDNTILAVGDVIGKIYFYYDPLTAKEGKIKSAKFHWHCKKVLSLRFNTISNVLLSGGSEVYYFNNKLIYILNKT